MPAQLGAYTIGREIGRGGMGVVYLGHDTRLDRAVAIKALPEHLAADPDRLARFEREARTLASLNHPNVAGIYGVEEHNGAKYLVLEYVEGETLADRLDRGPLPVYEALEIAIQIAAGIETAHEAGVIHRDLKPGNVIVTPEGDAKVLDFGLARVEGTSSSSAGSSESPTLTTPAIQHSPTIPGAILGTAAYMSPEQARGRRVDKCTDIWSFGVLLYEILTGASPFVGETVSDSIGAVLHKDVDLDRLPAVTPAMVRHVLCRCLERDKAKRYHDIGDVRLDLLSTTPNSGEADRTPSSSRSRIISAVLVTGAIALGVAGGYSARFFTHAVEHSPVVQSALLAPQDTTIVSTGDVAGPAVISPDGTMVVFTARNQKSQATLWLRSLATGESRPLQGAGDATFPFWSSDSRSIAFFTPGKLRRVDVATGAIFTVCSAIRGRGGVWLDDGTIVFSPDYTGPLLRVDATGGEPVQATTLDAPTHTSHRWPAALPKGKGVIYLAVNHNFTASENGLYLSTLDGAPDRLLMRSDSSAQVAGDLLLFVREGTLFAQRLDLDSAKLLGNPAPILNGVLEDDSTWRSGFSVSATGTMVCLKAATATAPLQNAGRSISFAQADRIVLLGRDGTELSQVADGLAQVAFGVSRTQSPDELLLAITLAQPNDDSYDLWLYPAQAHEVLNHLPSWKNSEPRRLTFGEGAEMEPVFSPDGKELVYGIIFSQDNRGLYRIRVSGGRAERLLEVKPGEYSVYPTDWSADGRFIVFVRGDWVNDRDNKLWVLPTGGGEPFLFRSGDEGVSIRNGALSPDGKWMAYVEQNRSVDYVFVAPFKPGWDDTALMDESFFQSSWRISPSDGTTPKWKVDGSEIYYMTSRGALMMVPVDIKNDTFSYAAAQRLGQTDWDLGNSFAASLMGEYFLIGSTGQSGGQTISLITNWRRLLDRNSER